MADHWDPQRYEQFTAQRAQPFWDLADLIDASASMERVVDLGCGTGALTAELVARLGVDEAIGVDSSTAMLEQAEAHASTRLSFEVGDIGVWTDDGEFDLVFSNAALHWVPDHASVLARWRDALRPGGQLAVQVPANADHPAPQAAARVARREPYFTALDENPPPDAVTANVASPERYAQALHELGFVEQSVRLQVYGHVLPSHDAVIEWIRGSTLTRFFARLPVEVHESFVDAVHAEYLSAVGPEEPVFYPFKRILMWGRLPQT